MSCSMVKIRIPWLQSVRCLKKRLAGQRLFAQVGTAAIGELLPDLALHAARNLPLLFSEQELVAKGSASSDDRADQDVG